MAKASSAMLQTRSRHAGKLIWHVALISEKCLLIVSRVPWSSTKIHTVPGTISMRLHSSIPKTMIIRVTDGEAPQTRYEILLGCIITR